MTWNYRVLRTGDESGGSVYRIHEVYYGDDGSIDGWTVEPVQPLGESLSELREDVRYFLAAFRKPVLEEAQEDGKPVLLPSDDDQEINEGHYFELMDRASVALDHCYQFVGSHPVTRRKRDAPGALREGGGGPLPRLPGGCAAGARERRGLTAVVPTAGGSTVGSGHATRCINLPSVAY